jgi:hypothetical protein
MSLRSFLNARPRDRGSGNARPSPINSFLSRIKSALIYDVFYDPLVIVIDEFLTTGLTIGKYFCFYIRTSRWPDTEKKYRGRRIIVAWLDRLEHRQGRLERSSWLPRFMNASTGLDVPLGKKATRVLSYDNLPMKKQVTVWFYFTLNEFRFAKLIKRRLPIREPSLMPRGGLALRPPTSMSSISGPPPSLAAHILCAFRFERSVGSSPPYPFEH